MNWSKLFGKPAACPAGFALKDFNGNCTAVGTGSSSFTDYNFFSLFQSSWDSNISIVYANLFAAIDGNSSVISGNLDGGFANSVYLSDQNIDGGHA
jgi:hypothetical protein